MLNQPSKISRWLKIRQYILHKKMHGLARAYPGSIHNWTAASIVVIATSLTGVVGITSYQVVRSLILEELEEKALLQVRKGTDNIDQWLITRSSEIQTIANTDKVRSLNWSLMEPYLQSEVKRINEFDFLSIMYRNGSFYNTRTGQGKTNNKDRRFIQNALAGNFNISDPFTSRIQGISLIAISAPIRANDRTSEPPIGVFSGILSLTRLQEVVNKLHYGKNSYAFALNSQGQAIIHPNAALMSTTDQPAPTFLNSTDSQLAAIALQMVNKHQGIELVPIDGTQKYVAIAPLHQVNWSIALVIPPENIESQLGYLNLLATILTILLLIGSVIAWRQIRLSEKAKTQVILLSQQHKTLQKQAQELEKTLQELQQTQTQLIQTEKMSSLGHLVAGIAHEINNPISFIYSNIIPAQDYIQDIFKLLKLYQQHYPNPATEIQEETEIIELDFLTQDLPRLLNSMQVGADRIKQIVQSLRNFSRLDESDMKEVNIHEGIDSTLLILENRLQSQTKPPKIAIIKKYSALPPVECYAGQLNQVFMNILINAIDALEESIVNHQTIEHPQIFIQTELTTDQQVTITIANNGPDIPENIQKKLFDPFFTTKKIGKGTGLGLFTSYQIITQKHHGQLNCISAPNQLTEFVITIPLKPGN